MTEPRTARRKERGADLDPAVLAAVRDLEFVARVTVDGTVSGLHRSPFHGYSAEFSQYRHYRPGDDFKYIDWKLFSRTDRVYTKVYRETTNMVAQVVVDASASMGFSGRTGVSKFAYARILASALAHLVSRQGDAVALVLFDEGIRRYLPGRTGPGHLRRLLVELAHEKPSGRTAAGHALRRSVDLLHRRGMVLLFSDLYDEEGFDRELKRAVRLGHELALFHVLTPDETAFPFRDDVELRDMETGARVVAHGDVANEYHRRFAAFLDLWRTRCASAGIDYVPVTTELSPARVLRRYLTSRARRVSR